MPPSQQKLLKPIKFKVTQPSNSSLMESKSITEDQELQIKCMDGLKKSLKLFCNKFLNKKLMNWNQKKALLFISVQTNKKEKLLNYSTLLIIPSITSLVHQKKISLFFIHWEKNPSDSQKILPSLMIKSNNGQWSTQFQLLFLCHQKSILIGFFMMKLQWRMLLCCWKKVMFQKKDTRISNNYVKRINKALNVVLLKEIMKFMEESRVISNPKVFQSLPLLEIPLKKPTHIQNPSINLQVKIFIII